MKTKKITEVLNIEQEIQAPHQIARKFIENLNSEKAKKFIQSNDSTGNKKVDEILNNSAEKEYYLLEEKIEKIRLVDKKFDAFYQNYYDQEIEETKQQIIKVLKDRK